MKAGELPVIKNEFTSFNWGQVYFALFSEEEKKIV